MRRLADLRGASGCRQFRASSGGRAALIDREAGGVFSLFARHIVGQNVELVAESRDCSGFAAVSWPERLFPCQV